LNSLYDGVEDEDDAVDGAGDADRDGIGDANSEDMGEKAGMARKSCALKAR